MVQKPEGGVCSFRVLILWRRSLWNVSTTFDVVAVERTKWNSAAASGLSLTLLENPSKFESMTTVRKDCDLQQQVAWEDTVKASTRPCQ